MKALEITLSPGKRIKHATFGAGVVIESTQDGYLRVLFTAEGEKEVPANSLKPFQSHDDLVLENVSGSERRLRQAWLACEAHNLPLLDNAAALTSAPIDLLPHQIVLTHRIATTSPRRFLVADEVGLGKTIETALVLRELESRNEMSRALIIVPAGLVNNWHEELNEVFNLEFEIFGSEGDVTDRRSNAFAKHNRIIASIDTLKRRSRLERLSAAPPWDLIVFDEAHHLTAKRSGNKIVKTENYKLAERLKNHTRDLVLLSATPHQGDNFRFWMLLQLLDPTLFTNAHQMVEKRHRLNEIVIRRTKANACQPDGSPLFARREVNTESFTMSSEEKIFYNLLKRYLQEGFALAKRRGDKARALGFIMTTFQKIAASSFAAVRQTLRRRLLMLTLHEFVFKGEKLAPDERDQLQEELSELVREVHKVSPDETESVVADLKFRLRKKSQKSDLALLSESVVDEDAIADAVNFSLPQERQYIRDLLQHFPKKQETKIGKLLRALGSFWQQEPDEKIVVFATYLSTIDLLKKEIEQAYPRQGVVILKGGDQGAKLVAEKKFKKPDGPKVLICSAAGREGINLQFSRILFNFDLPWNPMDIEQRIGRIHRYGQKSTAQVYNLVLSDTIEGKIFILLSDKLKAIASTLAKVDRHGNISEDFQMQILGQISEHLIYNKLYGEALSDPELKRTQEEIDQAISDASEAREVVFELFQDIDNFSIDQYKPLSNVTSSFKRIGDFLFASTSEARQEAQWINENTLVISSSDRQEKTSFVTDRELARSREDLQLIGIDHPFVSREIQLWQKFEPQKMGVVVLGDEGPAVVSWWLVNALGSEGEKRSVIQILAIDTNGQRLKQLENQGELLLKREPGRTNFSPEARLDMLGKIQKMLQRELIHKNFVYEYGGHTSKLICWVEICKNKK